MVALNVLETGECVCYRSHSLLKTLAALCGRITDRKNESRKD